MLNERAGELSGDPVVSARSEKEGVTERIGNFWGGTAQEGPMLFKEGMNKSWVRK